MNYKTAQTGQIRPKFHIIFYKKSPQHDFITNTLPTRKSQASYDKMTNGAATIHVVKESKITPTHKHQE